MRASACHDVIALGNKGQQQPIGSPFKILSALFIQFVCILATMNVFLCGPL